MMDIYFNLNESKKDKGGEIKTNKTFTLFEPHESRIITGRRFRKMKPVI